MGMSYTHHTMVGAYISGQMANLYAFLATNGYPLTEDEQEEIRDGGEFNYDIVERLQLGDMDIIMLNSWSGHDFVIGYHVDADNEESHKQFAKYFPKVKSQYHDFTEVS